MVEGGDLDLCYFSSSYLAGRVPSLRVLDTVARTFVVRDVTTPEEAMTRFQTLEPARKMQLLTMFENVKDHP